MYKVMLVDDDYPVIDFLQETIPWKDLNMEVIGEFDNGKKAYDFALSNMPSSMPDIIVTDIGMSHMNGLELIDGLLAHKEDIHAIILSCHDEFDYARQAIRLNVDDYILKESLEPEAFITLLLRIKQKLDTDKRVRKQPVFHDLLASLTDDPMMSETDWAEQTKRTGLDFMQYDYIPVLCFINRPLAAEQRYSTQKLFAFAIHNVIDEIIQAYDDQTIFKLSNHGDKTVLLFQYSDFVKNNAYAAISEILQKISESLQVFLKLSATFIIGQICEKPLQLKEHMKQLLKGKERSFYLQEGVIVKLEQLHQSYCDEELFSQHVEAIGQFQHLIMKVDRAKLQQLLADWIEELRRGFYKPQLVREWGIKILLDLRVKIKSLHFFETKFSEEVVHQQFIHTESLDHLHELMWLYMSDLLRIVQHINNGSKRREIVEAQTYVLEHMHEKISMSTVAQRLHLNAAYFSRLFKKETSENFMDYVLRLKMEKACEYLDHSDVSIDQISERLGFESKSYFIRTFRRLIGTQPAVWRHRSE
ncbi:helix-turn-helix domain-containing protein [Paenibacillus sp. LMG 31461]|uniref:Helix-turn-helix domain-containing protein n=1 Tax=Paenibacillus plantarum TaxID=2654975 RepID=A0ABX1XML7_9BACL|nr:helix-turn-helix domain-containing protein [Paenibacillus plantarum]NOU69674.1 helix-turn-helix domain-containing protein [Paenibacillus plantarum]